MKTLKEKLRDRDELSAVSYTHLDVYKRQDVTRIICFVSLFLLGFIKFLDYGIKAYINRHCCIRRNLSFSLSGLKVIVNIYGDPMAADVDGSQSLGWKETVFLALAMSIDSLVAGTMAALLDIPVADVYKRQSLSSARIPAPVRRLSRVDFPALV